ncbi:MAG TPA: hypothetical protein VK846_00830 [Candidatus Limnocylindria bacterium]|nr:hypothetical protein [Candidatus Limnocylindria bacterium]
MRFFKRRNTAKLPKLPSGAFALDRDGKVVVSTLPQSFPEAQMRDIGERVLAFFRGAQLAQMPQQELNVYYPSLKLTARSLRGGALIFLSPQTLPKN